MAVTTQTIAVALGRTTPEVGSPTESQWDMWIADALLLIEDRLGDPNLLDQAKVDYVVRKAVVAQVSRPQDGASQVDVSIDDGRTSRRYDVSEVSILDEWWDLLSPSPTETSGAFTISPTGAVDRIGDGPRDWVR